MKKLYTITLLAAAIFGYSQAQESCQICLSGRSSSGNNNNFCFMAQVGETSQQAPFVGNAVDGEVTLTSFTHADGGFCSDCVLTAYSKKGWNGRSQVLDFGENFEFSLDFCAKSYILDCTKTTYNPPDSEEEQEEEAQEEAPAEEAIFEEIQEESSAAEEAQEEAAEAEEIKEEEEAENEEEEEEKGDIKIY